MDFIGIIDALVRATFGYAIVFLVITLLTLPFVYSVVIYQRLKNRFTKSDQDNFELPDHVLLADNPEAMYRSLSQEILKQNEKIKLLIQTNTTLRESLVKFRMSIRNS